jgi:predicted nucleotidyltransferase component of viral defense system
VAERSSLRAHLDPPAFVEAVRFTAAKTGFDARLVEKDYFCTLLLEQLAAIGTLVFKGGTCLGKVHAGFYRLSEDLDFAIAIDAHSSRGERRSAIVPVKAALDGLEQRQPALRVAAPLLGRNGSRQYLATFAYASLVTVRDEAIKFEVALREPLLIEPVKAGAATLLLDPLDERPVAPAIPTTCIALPEAFAEKFRAALTRREPAIRDLFDIEWGVRSGLVAPNEATLVSLVRSKLAVPGNSPIDVSAGKLAALHRQVDSGLRPVLRPTDFSAFDPDRAFAVVSEMAAKVTEAR